MIVEPWQKMSNCQWAFIVRCHGTLDIPRWGFTFHINCLVFFGLEKKKKWHCFGISIINNMTAWLVNDNWILVKKKKKKPCRVFIIKENDFNRKRKGNNFGTHFFFFFGARNGYSKINEGRKKGYKQRASDFT